MSCQSTTTTVWTCDLCGGMQEEPMHALYYPPRPASATAMSLSFPVYESIDICDGCARSRSITDVLAFFKGRLT